MVVLLLLMSLTNVAVISRDNFVKLFVDIQKYHQFGGVASSQTCQVLTACVRGTYL